MVRVTVGETNSHETQVMQVQEVDQRRSIVRGINEKSLSSIMYDIALYRVAAHIAVHGLDSRQRRRGLGHPFVEHDLLKRLRPESQRVGERPQFSPIPRLVAPLKRRDVRPGQPGHPRQVGNGQIFACPRLLDDVAQIVFKRHTQALSGQLSDSIFESDQTSQIFRQEDVVGPAGTSPEWLSPARRSEKESWY